MQPRPGSHRGEEVNHLREIAKAAVLVRSTNNQICVSIPTGPAAQQVLSLRSPQFKQWLRTRHEAEHGTPPSEYLLRTAIDQIEAGAVFSDLPCQPVGPRCLTYEHSIAINLATPSGDCIEITAEGWRTTNSLGHAFTSTSGTAPLPEPQQPASDTLEQFRSLLNIDAGHDWTRVLTFLTAAVTGLGPCPILVLQGASGSGKTTAARMLKALLDPAIGTPGPLPVSTSALRKQVAGHHIFVVDDVHRIGPVKASEIARLADEESQPRAIILVRACSSTARLPEALERRALTVTFQEPETLRTLYDLKREFERLHPFVLGALCDAARQALHSRDTTAQPAFTRLADATMLALAAAPALHLAPSLVLAAIAEPALDLTRIASAATESRPQRAGSL